MRQFSLNNFLFICLAIAGLYLPGCSKNEQPVPDTPYTRLVFQTYSVDTLNLKLMVDETLITDSLPAPNGIKTDVVVQYAEPKHRVRLYDVFTNRLWLDTVVAYRPGFSNTITFFQPAAQSNFVYIGPPANDPVPVEGYANISIRYTHAALPDLLKVVVENNTSAITYTATDSFELRKDEFSKYYLGHYSGKQVRLKFYTNDASRKLWATVSEGEFAGIKSDYNIYLLRKHSSAAGGVYQLKAEKLY